MYPASRPRTKNSEWNYKHYCTILGIKDCVALPDIYLKRVKFCYERNSDPCKTNVHNIISTVHSFFESGVGCSELSTARPLLNSFIDISGITLRKHLTTTRFIRDILNISTFPKYCYNGKTHIAITHILLQLLKLHTQEIRTVKLIVFF